MTSVPERPDGTCSRSGPHIHFTMTSGDAGTTYRDCAGQALAADDPRIDAGRSWATQTFVDIALESLDKKLGSGVRQFFTTDELMAYLNYSMGKEPRDEHRLRWVAALERVVAEHRAGTLRHPNGAPAQQEAAPASKARTRRPKPSRLAKWEAHWQAQQQDAEGEQ